MRVSLILVFLIFIFDLLGPQVKIVYLTETNVWILVCVFDTARAIPIGDFI